MSLKKTKIIVTLGPSSFEERIILRMIREGVDGFRINFSHGTRDQWLESVKIIRECEEKTGTLVSLIGDLQGPNVRVGFLETPAILERDKEVHLVLSDKSSEPNTIPIPCREFFEVLEEGDRVVFADGEAVVEISEATFSEATARVVIEGKVSSRKSVSIDGKNIPLPPLTAKDKEDLKFAVEQGFSHIMLSFVRSRNHVRIAKRYLEKSGKKDLWIISKIETREGVENLDEIIDESNGIVVARGDLGKHFPLEKIPAIQKKIIEAARKRGRMVILATQLLSSMIENPIPTRSEVVDVYNAVIEGSDALMLTNETAIGKYPVAAVRWLRKIIEEAESSYETRTIKPEFKDISYRFACGVVELASSLNAKIIVYSMTGGTAEKISLYRPPQGFFVGVPSKETARKINILWGAFPIVVEAKDYLEGLNSTREALKTRGVIDYGDILIETYRLTEEESNIIKITRL